MNRAQQRRAQDTGLTDGEAIVTLIRWGIILAIFILVLSAG